MMSPLHSGKPQASRSRFTWSANARNASFSPSMMSALSWSVTSVCSIRPSLPRASQHHAGGSGCRAWASSITRRVRLSLSALIISVSGPAATPCASRWRVRLPDVARGLHQLLEPARAADALGGAPQAQALQREQIALRHHAGELAVARHHDMAKAVPRHRERGVGERRLLLQRERPRRHVLRDAGVGRGPGRGARQQVDGGEDAHGQRRRRRRSRSSRRARHACAGSPRRGSCPAGS